MLLLRIIRNPYDFLGRPMTSQDFLGFHMISHDSHGFSNDFPRISLGAYDFLRLPRSIYIYIYIYIEIIAGILGSS